VPDLVETPIGYAIGALVDEGLDPRDTARAPDGSLSPAGAARRVRDSGA
jgi:hypothetical protein